MPETPSADALGVFVDLLAELDADGETGSRPVYDRVCEAICRLTSMRRAALFLYDADRRLVVPAGSHGVEPGLLSLFYGTLDETPLAEQALAGDRVMHVADLEGTVPERYVHMPDITALTCVPVAAGGRWLGVIFADRDGEDFTLTERELHAMWMLGKMAAISGEILHVDGGFHAMGTRLDTATADGSAHPATWSDHNGRAADESKAKDAC
jgi:hypothetical protein